MITDTIIEDPRWQAADLPGLAERAARASLHGVGLDPNAYELAVLGCDDSRIATLNADFRGKPVATNVLSWPSNDLVPGDMPEEPELGDIAIAFDTCEREATQQGKPLANHVTHLLVHGVLHLLGYDHLEEEEAEEMERLERQILATLGLPDPYL